MSVKMKEKPKGWLDFKAIKEAADFETVLARYELGLSRRGEELVGRCPFHEETRGSFRVNLRKGVFHCFGCGEKGNVLDFVAKLEGVGIRRAAELVAEWCGIKENADATGSSGKGQSRDAGVNKAKESVSPAESGSQPEGLKALSFTLRLDPTHPYLLEDRGLSGETIAHFGLGYCNRGLMRGRVCVPLHDAEGNLVAYAGRWVGPDEDLPEGEGKYKLPPKFEKSRVLFNLHRIPRWAVTRVEEVILVEGYFSVFSLHQRGFPNVVSCMGRAVSAEQKRHLAERFDRVRIFFDGDDAGRKAAEAIALELAQDLHVRIAPCPHGKQPDHLTSEELKALLG